MTAPTLARTATGAVRIPMVLATGFDAIKIDIYHRLRTEVGTALEDAARGLPWLRWASTLPVVLPEVAAQVRAQLGAVSGVVSVDTVTPSLVAGVLRCAATCTVRLDGNAYSLSVAVSDPYQTSGPPLLWQVLPVG